MNADTATQRDVTGYRFGWNRAAALSKCGEQITDAVDGDALGGFLIDYLFARGYRQLLRFGAALNGTGDLWNGQFAFTQG